MAPAAIPFIVAGAAIIGAGASVYGAAKSGQAETEAGAAAQAAANEQARLADLNAIDAIRRGDADAAKLRSMGSKVVSAQRVAYAASGVDVSSGTAVDVFAETRALAELDALTAKNNAAREAWGHKKDAKSLRTHGVFARQAGENRATGTYLTGGANAVGLLGNAALNLSKTT